MALAMEAPRTIASFFQHLLQLKKEGGLEDVHVYAEAGALHILGLKQVHRELCEATEALREATSEAKTQLDQSSLQLQNLLYEQQHYEKEIAGCRAYKSAYPDEQLELPPVEELRQQWRGKEPLSDDPHKLMLTRLSHELASREETVRQLDAIKSKRDTLAADVAAKRSVLSALEAEIAKLRQAAQRVQQQFSIAAPGPAEASQLIGMLPLPLYVLHSQLAAAAALPATAGVAAELCVLGGEDAAAVERLRAMHRSPSAPSAGGMAPAPTPTALAGDAPEAHPLSLRLALRKTPLTDSAPSLGLTLRYIPSLHLVTVEGDRRDAQQGAHAKPADHALLASLFPGDDGEQLPPAAAAGGAGEGGGAAAAGVDVRQLPGRPYRWAQHAAGIDVLPPLSPYLYNATAGEGAVGAAVQSGGSEGGPLAVAGAGLQQYLSERRAAAIFGRLVEAVMAPSGA